MTLIPNTRKKLREASFFFGNMMREARTTSLDKEDFSFYLSAFLSAGRSITFVLEKEQGDSYKTWFQPVWMKSLSEEEKLLLDFMNDQRVAEVHQLGAETQESVEMSPLIHELMKFSPQYAWYGDTGAPGAPAAEIGQQVYYFEINDKPEEATDVCRRYLDLLTRAVNNFEMTFPT